MIKCLFAIFSLCAIFCTDVRADVIYREANGMNGYYTEFPLITITHDGKGDTRYRLKSANGHVLTGTVNEENLSVVLPMDKLAEGTNCLDVWVESKEGEIHESTVRQIQFLIDQTAPEYPLQFVEGDVLKIAAKDKISGIAGIYISIKGEEFRYVKGEQAFIDIPKNFEGKISAYAVDLAGNEGDICHFEKRKSELIITTEKPSIDVSDEEDIEKPQVVMEGIPKIPIMRERATIFIAIKDNILLKEVEGLLNRRYGNEVENYELTEWEENEKGYFLQQKIEKDGIYKFFITAKDEKENSLNTCRHLVIDTQAPVIHSLEQINGKSMEEFQWNFDLSAYVSDFTSCYYEIRIDGILYERNEVYKKPGKHILEIYVRDLAGNETKKVVSFYIRPTTGRKPGD